MDIERSSGYVDPNDPLYQAACSGDELPDDDNVALFAVRARSERYEAYRRWCVEGGARVDGIGYLPFAFP